MYKRQVFTLALFYRRNATGTGSGNLGGEINRTPYSRHYIIGGTNEDLYSSSVRSNIIMYLNGETDFVNVMAYGGSEDSQNVTLFTGPYHTWFSGQLISRSPIGDADLNAIT